VIGTPEADHTARTGDPRGVLSPPLRA
jgi:hypothetical protein